MLTRLLLAVLLLASVRLAASEPEWQARQGLPGVATRAKAGTGELRVAYLGGSITAAEGWRPLMTTYLREQWPTVTIHEINAGLPGTGSDLGACRVGPDVLAHKPDLVFVEFAVNDNAAPPEQIERTMEGIVRQVLRANPATDLCFVYTLSTPNLPELTAGRLNPSAQAMERVADRYGIPTVAFGFEVAKRVAAGELIFKGTAEDGAKAFSLDGVHPTASGHRVYLEVLRRAWPELLKASGARGPLPEPLRPDNWERAEQRALTDKMRQGDWQKVALDDPNLRGSTKALLTDTWRASTPGAALEFEFTGTRLGLLGIAAPDNGSFTVRVDDGEPVSGTFFDAYVTTSFCRQKSWFYPQPLTPGRHRVRVELINEPVDKAAIRAKASKTLETPEAYTAQRLTIVGLLLIDLSEKKSVNHR